MCVNIVRQKLANLRIILYKECNKCDVTEQSACWDTCVIIYVKTKHPQQHTFEKRMKITRNVHFFRYNGHFLVIIISTVLGQVHHDGQHGNAARCASIFANTLIPPPRHGKLLYPHEICTECFERLASDISLGDKILHFVSFIHIFLLIPFIEGRICY